MERYRVRTNIDTPEQLEVEVETLREAGVNYEVIDRGDGFYDVDLLSSV